MKKIFLFLFLVFTTNLFAGSITLSQFLAKKEQYTFVLFSATSSTYYTNTPHTAFRTYGEESNGKYSIAFGSATVEINQYYKYKYNGGIIYYSLVPKQSNDQCKSTVFNGIVLGCDSDGNHDFIPNPDTNSNDNQCSDLFEKNGQAYTCNPNTNEATPIDNSNGLTTDPETGDNIPNCNEGYEYTVLPSGMNPSGDGTSSMYNQYGCASSSGTGNTGGDTGTGGEPTTTTNPDGSTTMTMPDGTKHTTYGDGTVITTYPDGTQTTSNGGVSGGTGGSTGGNNNTPSENGQTGDNNDMTPTDPATSCNDSNMTLQEKMMCEMNQGIKNLNGDTSSAQSLNNLMKDINADNNKNAEAINKNIKDFNTNVSGKIDTTNQLLTTQNKTLDSLATKQNTTNTLLGATNNNLTDINKNLEDTEGKSYLQTLIEKITDLTAPMTDEDKTNYTSQVNQKVSNTLNETFSNYSNILGLSSSYAPAPANITVTLFGMEFVLIDFSLLDPYVTVIRSLFLTLAYLYGFLFFLRGAK